MKKKTFSYAAIMFLMMLMCAIGFTSCPDGNTQTRGGEEVPPGTVDWEGLQGKLLILQAYGTGEGNQAGATHSFVELYNNSTASINLDDFFLWYADGTRPATAGDDPASTDGEWKQLKLEGSIPAKTSYLILGPKRESGRLQIEEDSGDINDDEFVLGNRSFKVALIYGTTVLNEQIQNPFDKDGEGTRVVGYIDMVGAANNIAANNRPDQILGYETAHARNSGSEGIRRKDLTDTNNNEDDFESVRYALSSDTNPTSIPEWAVNIDELFKFYRPKNIEYGVWDPTDKPTPEDPGDEYAGLPQTVAGAQSAQAGKLLILQIGAGAADAETNVTRSFVELYNAGETSVNLSGFTLQYATGTKTANNASKDEKWQKIDLEGTIAAGHSFLILGSKISTMPSPALDFANDAYGDMYEPEFVLSNRAVKVALIQGADLLTVQNPFTMAGGKAVGYVDMIGVTNDTTDQILGLEGTLSLISGQYRISKQVGIRRTSLTDSDVNSDDFRIVTYNSIKNDAEQFELMRPKNHAYGEWDPFAEPEPPEPTDNTLLILQIGAATDGNISHSFVELYNNGDAAVNLSGYSLQYAEGTRETEVANRPNTNTEDGPWAKIDLSGTIPPQHSFLILGDEGIGQPPTPPPALALTADSGDMNVSFVISNRSFKVALMSNTTLLTVQNPFDTDGAGAKASGYVDMVGAMNTAGEDKINGYEGNPITNLNKQTGQRRISLVDTDDNANDFTRATFLGASAASLAKLRPKNLAHGAWDPFTDTPIIQPGEGSPKLMILQANTYGNNSNGGFSKSLVELYNNTDAAINLDGYYLHIGSATAWTAQIDLSGKTIPAKKSFLVVSSTENVADTSADLPTEDLSASFGIANNNFKVALMCNNRSTLSVDNPFTEPSLAADYVDMLGTGTANGENTAAGQTSRPRPARRASLADTDNNAADFTVLDYRTDEGNRITTPDFYKYWPRSATMEAWDPITGLPEVQPQNINARHNP